MLISLDNVFVDELRKNGIDTSYKKLLEIYRESRKNPICIRRKKENAILNAMMYEMMYENEED